MSASYLNNPTLSLSNELSTWFTDGMYFRHEISNSTDTIIFETPDFKVNLHEHHNDHDFLGEYTVHTTLLDSDGNEIATTTTAYTITNSP